MCRFPFFSWGRETGLKGTWTPCTIVLLASFMQWADREMSGCSEKRCFSNSTVSCSFCTRRTNSVQWQAACKYPAPPGGCNWICNPGEDIKWFCCNPSACGCQRIVSFPIPLQEAGEQTASRYPRKITWNLWMVSTYSAGWCSEGKDGLCIGIMGIWYLHTALKKHNWGTNPAR